MRCIMHGKVTVFSRAPGNNMFHVYRAANLEERMMGNHIVIDYTLDEKELMKNITREERNDRPKV